MAAAVKAELPAWLKKILGRWKGDSYRAYEPKSLARIAAYTKTLFEAAVGGTARSKVPLPGAITHAAPDPFR